MEDACRVVKMSLRPDGVVLLMNRPLIIDVGKSIMEGAKVALSEPIAKGICCTFFEWIEMGKGATEVLEMILRKCSKRLPLIEARFGNKMMVVYDGRDEYTSGHGEIIVESRTFAKRAPVFKMACHKCHGLAHTAIECDEWWKDYEPKLSRTEELGLKWYKDSPPEVGSMGIKESSPVVVPPNAMTEEKHVIFESETDAQGTEDEQETVPATKRPKFGEDIAGRDVVGTSNTMSVDNDMTAERVMDEPPAERVIDEVPEENVSDERIEEMAERKALSMMALDQAQGRDMDQIKAVMKKELIGMRRARRMQGETERNRESLFAVECGGNGDCGLYAMMAGLMILGKLRWRTKNLKKESEDWIRGMREMVDAETIQRRTNGEVSKRKRELLTAWKKADPNMDVMTMDKELQKRVKKCEVRVEVETELKTMRRRENNWYSTADILVMARLTRTSVVIVQADPVTRNSAMEVCDFGEPDEGYITIFGGTRFRGGHWIALVRDLEHALQVIQLPEKRVYWNGIQSPQTLAGLWREAKVDWESLDNDHTDTKVIATAVVGDDRVDWSETPMESDANRMEVDDQ